MLLICLFLFITVVAVAAATATADDNTCHQFQQHIQQFANYDSDTDISDAASLPENSQNSSFGNKFNSDNMEVD